ncbi:DUF11 domain-containing protein [Candidatus Peregrinibacteria bacterium]|nr:MAG: DUF11 domain-containing protein [Candidatus Peregrinibacteria bacterium]
MLKKIFLIGTFLLSITGAQHAFAEHYSHSDTVSGMQVYLPEWSEGAPGQNGSFPVRVGEAFPSIARGDMLGFSFTVSWDESFLEFLGADIEHSVFSGDNFEYTVNHNPLENTANISIFTGSQGGVVVKPGDDLIWLLFRVRSSAKVGKETLVTFSNTAVAYDSNILKSAGLPNTQGGRLLITSGESPNTTSPSQDTFFIPKNTLAKPGTERLIPLIASKTEPIAGLLFDVTFPAEDMTFLGVETEGSALAQAGFEFLTDTSVPNHIAILGATGDLKGATLSDGETTLFLRFSLSEKVTLGKTLPMSIPKMTIVSPTTLKEEKRSVREGSVLTSETGEMGVRNVTPLSSTSVRILFNDDISVATLNDFSFSPKLKNVNTTFEKNGKFVTIRNLTTMLPEKRYRVDIAETVSGNRSGLISKTQNFGFFLGFPTQSPLSAFFIESVTALSNTSLQITFSKDVNMASLELEDFALEGLSITNATSGANARKIIVTTSDQSVLTGSTWLSIQNKSTLHDLISQNGELLSRNVAPLLPYGLSSFAPTVTSVSAEKSDLVHITFDKPLLASSLTENAFSIREEGKTENLITGGSYLSISADRLTVTLNGVRTLAGRQYRLEIDPGKLKGNTSDQPIIGMIGNIGSFLGQGSSYTPWDFAIESIESLGKDSVRVSFSEDLGEFDIAPLFSEIWTINALGAEEPLRILSAKKEGNTVTFTTDAQSPNALYYLLFSDRTRVVSSVSEILGVPNSSGFLGYSEQRMRITGVTPNSIAVGTATEITLSGIHFPEGMSVRLGNRTFSVQRKNDEEALVTLPNDIPLNVYDIIVVAPDGTESRLPNALLVVDPQIEERFSPKILSEESYANPFRVPNDGVITTTLWVRIEDPRGVSDIDKVTADLRIVGGPAVKEFSRIDFVDDKAWYSLEISIPSNVPTSTEITEIPVTVQNKSGQKGFGTVSLMVSRDMDSGIPPEIVSATATPDRVAPGSATEVTFQTEIFDEDGGGDVTRVVLDASKIGLGIIVLPVVPEVEEDRNCVRSDYIVGEWGGCGDDDLQRRSVELKPGLECRETGAKPDAERDCVLESTSFVPKWLRFSPKRDILLDLFFPRANAETVYGKRSWFTSPPKKIPSWVPEGTYNLPLTVLDREGEEIKGSIQMHITRDTVGSPEIDKDDVYISPKATISNDDKTTFRIFAKAVDPNGADDIVSVSVGLGDIGLPAAELVKGQTEGPGAWYATEELTIPRSVIPGFRNLTVVATDTEGNQGKADVRMLVTTPEESGDGPILDTDLSYTNPRSFRNNQKEQGTLYMFVEEGDAPIAHLTANLGTVLQYVQPEENSEQNTEEGACVSTDTFVCLVPSVTEGARGQWYYLPNLIVREKVAASQNPYFISVVATDTDGRRTEAEVPVFVNDGILPLSDRDLPNLVSAVATGRKEVQAYFSSALDPKRIRREAFRIVFSDNTSESLPVQNVHISSDRQTVTLETNAMNAGDRLTLITNAETLGLRDMQPTDNQADFLGYDEENEAKKLFEISYAKAIAPNAVEIVLRKDIRFSTLNADGSNFRILMDNDKEGLPVRGAQLGENARTIILSTGLQEVGKTYVVKAENLLDFAGGNFRKGGDVAVFSAYNEAQRNDFLIKYTTEKPEGIIEKGEDVVLMLRVSNSEDAQEQNNVALSLTYPSSALSFTGATSSGGVSCGDDGKKVTCNIESLPPSSEYQFRLVFRSISSGVFSSTATAVSGEATLGTASVGFTVVDPGSPFSLQKTSNREEAESGEDITYTITITNRTGGNILSDVVVTDTFPETLLGLKKVSSSSGIPCQYDASKILCLIPYFAPGSSYTITSDFTALAEGTAINTVSVSASQKNDEGTEEVTTSARSATVLIYHSLLSADFNNDGRVDFFDFTIFSDVYNTNGKDLPETDMNRDGRVDFLDFTLFAEQYGKEEEKSTPPPIPKEEAGSEDASQNNDASLGYFPSSVLFCVS